MPFFLSALLGALPAVVSGVSSLFGGGGGGGGFLSGLFGGGGGAPRPPTVIQAGARPGAFNPFRTPGIFGGPQPGGLFPSVQVGPPLPSFPRGGRTSFGRGRGRVPQLPLVRPVGHPPSVPLVPHDFTRNTARHQLTAAAQFQEHKLVPVGGGTFAACPRGAPHGLPTVAMSMSPERVARVRLGASCA